MLGNIVLVALTGYGNDMDRQRSKEVGFAHHLVKPASFGEIEKILLGVSEKDDLTAWFTCRKRKRALIYLYFFGFLPTGLPPHYL